MDALASPLYAQAVVDAWAAGGDQRQVGEFKGSEGGLLVGSR